jgi:hypothetical protein
MNRKSVILLVLAMIFLFVFALTAKPAEQENPYDLFGKGNCVYFCWDMMRAFWPETFKVEFWWDAWEWKNLDGMEHGDYRAVLKSLKEIQPRDFIIIPASARTSHGHTSFVLGVDPEDRSVLVVESTMYACDNKYPYIYNSCRFRFHVYQFSELKDQGARILRCEKILESRDSSQPRGMAGA